MSLDYKQEFADLLAENRLEDARILLEKYKIYALDDPFYYGNMGWLLNHMERYQEAEIYLLKGIHQFGEDGWMHSQLGFCYDRQRRIKEGMEELLTALELGFDEAWIHGEIGWCFKEAHEYEQAVNCFEDALLDDPNNTWLLAQAASCYLSLDKKEQALEYYLKSYQLDPDSDACFDLANYYHQKEDYEREIQYLEKIHEKEHEPWKEFQIANAYISLHRAKDALEHLKKAEAAGKGDTSLHALMGDAYRLLDDMEHANAHYDRALSYYEKAIHREKEHYWIYQEMIWIAHKQRDWKKKLAFLKRAEKEKKDDMWLMYHFARCYSDLGDYEHAENACEFCLSHGEQGMDMFDLYAWNLGRDGKERKAIEVLAKRLKRFGADGWAYGELGWNYLQLQEYEKALEYFVKARKKEPKNAMHPSMSGWCHYQLDELEDAICDFTTAMQLGRKDGWIFASMAEVLAKADRKEEAIQYYEQALAQEYGEDWIPEEVAKLKKEEVAVS